MWGLVMKIRGLFALVLLVVLLPSAVLAGGEDPDYPFPDKKKAAPAAKGQRSAAPVKNTPLKTCGWKTNLGVGVSIWSFDSEDTETAPAAQLGFSHCQSPLTFSVGYQGGNHVNLDQASAQSIAEFPGKQPQVTLIRIPLGIEYEVELNEKASLFLGGGPDIIRTANDKSDTSIGGHLGVRLGYALADSWSLSVEAGYLWADVDSNGTGDIELDTAYITPLLTYVF